MHYGAAFEMDSGISGVHRLLYCGPPDKTSECSNKSMVRKLSLSSVCACSLQTMPRFDRICLSAVGYYRTPEITGADWSKKEVNLLIYYNLAGQGASRSIHSTRARFITMPTELLLRKLKSICLPERRELYAFAGWIHRKSCVSSYAWTYYMMSGSLSILLSISGRSRVHSYRATAFFVWRSQSMITKVAWSLV